MNPEAILANLSRQEIIIAQQAQLILELKARVEELEAREDTKPSSKPRSRDQ